MTKNNDALINSYQSVLRCLGKAVDQHNRGLFDERDKSVQHALRIVHDLFVALDFKRGGEVAENLGFIYCSVLYQLPKVSIQNSIQPIVRCLKLLMPLYNSWEQLRHSGQRQANQNFNRREPSLTVYAS